ncbi:MAG: hypothetical protein U9P00_11505, partial [Pseudomonadota bacterium]|nr:hypothetical protein [Pseudomonadota bacterium]
MKTRLISFFADIDSRSYYSDHAKRLSQACQTFAIPHDIRPLRSRGSYRRNCLHKPRFILDRLNEYCEPLLWLDVDSCIHKPLDIFDSFTGLDVVAASAYGTLGGMKASPLYFGDTDNAREFLRVWVE